ncbi:hypothetical protein EDC94DRAFT_598910, partial [Helicostylum pulchrum]
MLFLVCGLFLRSLFLRSLFLRSLFLRSLFLRSLFCGLFFVVFYPCKSFILASLFFWWWKLSGAFVTIYLLVLWL